jgi:hypothetical protein
VRHQINRVRESAWRPDERTLSPWWIATERHDILDAVIGVFLQDIPDLHPRGPYAGHVGNHSEAGVLTNPDDQPVG